MQILIFKLIRYLLNLCLWFILKIAGFVSFIYIRLWGFFGIPWFDHRFDWLRGPTYWVWNERGIYGSRVIRPGDKVLDVCCGDGIYSGLYYSMFAGLVHGIDRNESAIAAANKSYAKENVKFFKIDILKERFPAEDYDAIFMFAALEHFSAEQGKEILGRIAKALSKSSSGIFLGSTPIFEEATGHGHPEHVNEFTSIEKLKSFLSPYFSEIDFWSSKWGTKTERKEVYFLCKKPM